jgi:hypothetical protein
MFCALNLSMWRTEVTVLRTWRLSSLRPSDGFSYQKEDQPQLTHPVTHPSKPASSALNAASSPKPTVSNPSAETAKILDNKVQQLYPGEPMVKALTDPPIDCLG